MPQSKAAELAIANKQINKSKQRKEKKSKQDSQEDRTHKED
jgi:hypothetical protein